MRTMIYSLALIASLTVSLTSSKADDKTNDREKRLEYNNFYFKSTDEMGQATFISQLVGFVGDPMLLSFDP